MKDLKRQVSFLLIFALAVLMFAAVPAFAQDASDGRSGDAPAQTPSGDGPAGPVTAYSVQSNGDNHLYSIDLTTGASTDLGLVGTGAGEGAEGMAWVGADLDAIGGTINELWNITTPPGVLIGNTGARNGVDAGMASDPTTGTTYNLQGGVGAGSLYTVNTADGSTTLVGSNSNFADGLAINCAGEAFASDAIFSDGLYSVNLSDGSTTFIGGFGLGDINDQSGLAFDSDGNLWMLSDNGDIYTVNTADGSATFIATVDVGGGFEGLASEQNCDAGPRATFAVAKTFDDGNTSEVEVTLSCNTGLPLEQTTTIAPGDGVNFVVVDFSDGEMDCTVTETSGPDGYSVEYFDGTTTSSEPCAFESVGFGDAFSCRIDNFLEEVEVEVTKVWIDENPQFEAQNVAGATWSCSNVAFPCEEGFFNGCDGGNLDFFGNPGEDSFFVFPDWESGTTCSITEVDLLESGIEVDDSECQGLVVFPGAGASCTIFNTRLFEGIPTLSQYGLGLLALLMLGVGFVAFRRVI